MYTFRHLHQLASFSLLDILIYQLKFLDSVSYFLTWYILVPVKINILLRCEYNHTYRIIIPSHPYLREYVSCLFRKSDSGVKGLLICYKTRIITCLFMIFLSVLSGSPSADTTV